MHEMTRRCPVCGREYPKDKHVCSYCGINIDTGQPLRKVVIKTRKGPVVSLLLLACGLAVAGTGAYLAVAWSRSPAPPPADKAAGPLPGDSKGGAARARGAARPPEDRRGRPTRAPRTKTVSGIGKVPDTGRGVRSGGTAHLRPWQRILLEDKVFAPGQLAEIEKAPRGVSQFIKGYAKASWNTYIRPEPRNPVSIDRVISLYGRPDRMRTVTRGSVYSSASRPVDEYCWGKIALVTKSKSRGVIGLRAPGQYFLDGIKKSAERGR